MKFIPVRGRKLSSYGRERAKKEVEIYPREGTETLPITRDFTGCMVEIYPREGTETCFRPRSMLKAEMLKFIPVRGRKLEKLNRVIFIHI